MYPCYHLYSILLNPTDVDRRPYSVGKREGKQVCRLNIWLVMASCCIPPVGWFQLQQSLPCPFILAHTFSINVLGSVDFYFPGRLSLLSNFLNDVTKVFEMCNWSAISWFCAGVRTKLMSFIRVYGKRKIAVYFKTKQNYYYYYYFSFPNW